MSLSSLPRSLILLSLGILLGSSTTYLLTRDSPRHSQKEHEQAKEEITEGIENLIGNTKLLKIRSLSRITNCEILAKTEVSISLQINITDKFLNPGGSPKDRVALAILNSITDPEVTPVYEGTSGSP